MTVMSRFCLLGLLVTVFSLSSEAQSRLNFPRILSVQDLSTTGFAFVNTSSSSVAATFNSYGANGILTGQAIVNVPAKGQIAKLGSEVLTTVSASSWIQVLSSSNELQGFELVGDFATVVDGAGPAPEATQLAVIAFSAEDVVHLVNPSSQATTVTLRLNSGDGTTLGSTTVSLTPFQGTSVRLADLTADGKIDLLSISTSPAVAISASLTTKVPGGADIGVTNATATSGAPSELFFPYAPSGPQGASNWETLLGVANLSATAQTVSITFNADGSAPVTIQRNLAPGASIGDSVAKLFSPPATQFTAGWIRVTGSAALVGVAAYRDAANGSLAIVPSQSTGSTRFFFGHIASIFPWYTGIALLNNTTTAANVEIYAIDGSGQSIGALASFTLAANTRRTALLSEFVSQVLQRLADGGWVFVRSTNNVPLLGFELFGHFVYPILANVQGFGLPATSSFVPPTPTSAGGVSLDRVSFTDGTAPKTQFKPLDAIAYVAAVSNSSGSTGSITVTLTVKDPRNQTMTTLSRDIPLPTTTTEVVFLSFLPSNALNGQYTAIASFVYQGQTLSRSATFEVTGGTSSPTAGQETPLSFASNGTLQSVFRPGDAVQFIIPTANFTGQPVTAVINYQLTGPGLLNAGSGTLNFTMPVGISFQTIAGLTIPSNAPQGLFALSSALTVGTTTSTKGIPVTVVPKSADEAITTDSVFVTDSKGVPRNGFEAGANVFLNVWRISTFPTTTPVTVRNEITGPLGGSILGQPIAVSLPTGGTLGTIPFSLNSNAPFGNYTFQGTVTYQDNSNSTKSTSLSTTFAVPPGVPLQETVTTLRPYTRDYNFITRSSFSPGESIFLFRIVYSTFAAPVSGTIRYQVTRQSTLVLDTTLNTTFNPGINISFIGVTTTPTIPTATYTLTTTATAQGQSSANSATFNIAGPGAPNFIFGLTDAREETEMSSTASETLVK